MVRRVSKSKQDSGRLKISEIENSDTGLKEMFANFIYNAIDTFPGNSLYGEGKVLVDIEEIKYLNNKEEYIIELKDSIEILKEKESVSDFNKRVAFSRELEKDMGELIWISNRLIRLGQNRKRAARASL